MTGLTLTLEQLRSAPPGVRHWFEQEISAAFHAIPAPPPPPKAPELAACLAEEAMLVFEAIRDDFAAAQVFLELGREAAIGSASHLHALSIGEIKRRLRLTDERLSECFRVIGQHFGELRGDAGAALFGFDTANHVYIHETTHRSIRGLWEGLVQASSRRPSEVIGAPPTVGFAPPSALPDGDLRAD